MRVAIVTPYFPIREEPYRGQPLYLMLRELRKLVDLTVYCPLAKYPSCKYIEPRSYRYYRADVTYSPGDVPAVYFRYPVFPVLTRIVNGWTCAQRLHPYLAAARPDLILNYWIYPEGYAAVMVGQALGAPVITGALGSDIRFVGNTITRYLKQQTITRSSGVITVSEELRQRTIQLGADAALVRTIPNGCDADVFRHADRQVARQELGVAPDAEVLLFVGWLSTRKGLRELLAACVQLLSAHPRLELVCIGEGYYSSAIQNWAARHLALRVRLTGRCAAADVARWLAAANVFTLPSYSEGCPNVVIESLMCGRPVVATHVGGIPELVDDSCGILVPPRNPERLAAALDHALNRAWPESNIAGRSRRCWRDVARETYDFCQSIIAKCRPLRSVAYAGTVKSAIAYLVSSAFGSSDVLRSSQTLQWDIAERVMAIVIPLQ